MPTIDFTLEDFEQRIRGIVREEIVAERVYTHAAIGEAKTEIVVELDRTRRMLSEDILAESGRLDKTIHRLDRHTSDSSLHSQS